jgi:hypothetical protein
MLRSAPYSPPFCPCACPISLHTLLVISAAAKATLDGFDQRDYLEGKSETASGVSLSAMPDRLRGTG